jgi:hypothetical protein
MYDGFWVTHTDAQGDIFWHNYFDPQDTFEYDDDVYLYVSSLIQLSDGGFAIIGRMLDYPATRYNFFLLRLDRFGNILWTKIYGGTLSELGRSVIECTTGGFALVGETHEDLWLLRTDEQGTLIWNRTYGGIDKELCSTIVEAEAGGFTIAGSTYSFGAGGFDMWVLHTDHNGNLLWNLTFGSSDHEMCRDMIVTPSGDYLLAGTTYNNTQSQADAVFVCITSTGTLQWHHTYSAVQYDGFDSVAPTWPDGFVAVGETFNDTYYELWIVHTNATGYPIWTQRYTNTTTYFSYPTITASHYHGFTLLCTRIDLSTYHSDLWLLRFPGPPQPTPPSPTLTLELLITITTILTLLTIILLTKPRTPTTNSHNA